MFKKLKPRSILYAGLALVSIYSQGALAQTTECIDSSTGERWWSTSGNYYQLWNWNLTGTSCMTVNSGLTFATNYAGIDNHLARRGLYYGTGHGNSYNEVGQKILSYTAEWNPQWVTDGNSSIGFYGWTNNPVAELYIVENWYQWNHGRADNREDIGVINLDGVVYDVYRIQQNDRPTPFSSANSDFPQYVSVRRGRGSDQQNVNPGGFIRGAINLTRHLQAWDDLGFDMSGELYELTLNVEGWESSGAATVSELTVSDTSTQRLNFSGFQIFPGGGAQLGVVGLGLPGGPFPTTVTVTVEDGDSGDSNNDASNVVVSGNGGTYQFLSTSAGEAVVKATLWLDGVKQDTMIVTLGTTVPSNFMTFRALGTTGTEEVMVTLNGVDQQPFRLTTDFQIHTTRLDGSGEVGIKFTNDDAIANGRDVRLDYVEVNGIRRETEAMATNTGVFANGSCGGGGYSEWMHCNGSVNYGQFNQSHTITIRARGNAGGEHIHLLIDGKPVNGGWSLGTGYQEYTATVSGSGDINVKFDNDGGTKDVVVDWLKVDNRNPRQAENMQYNTGVFANGRCGGAGYSQWMHCNGVIGFGKISDTFDQ